MPELSILRFLRRLMALEVGNKCALSQYLLLIVKGAKKGGEKVMQPNEKMQLLRTDCKIRDSV